MDRNKPSKSSKTKVVPHHGSELYALGASYEKKGSDRKRDAPSSLSSSIKKPKLSASLSTPRTETTSSNVLDYWEQVALECEPVDLVQSIISAIDQQDSDTVVALVCGAIKLLIAARGKPDSVLTLSFLYLAKMRPNLFCNETITSALVSVLKRDSQHTFKGRNNPTVHILAANLLARGYHDKKQWPETFLKLYIDDAINERVWLDYDDCSSFVENICTAFGTKTPPKSMLQPELSSINPSARETLGVDEESGDSSLLSDAPKSGEFFLEYNVLPRYAHMTPIAEKLVLDTIKEQLNRRQTPDCSTRNFLKFLASTSGLVEVRIFAVTRLELWIHNGKLMKPAQELLTYICYNVSGQLQRDHEVLANLVKMRLKTKPLINIYMICLKEMINLQPEILYILLKYVVQNELSNARNPNNMGMLANMFQVKPDESARHLAEIYQEFLMQREDCLRTLRVFLRELVKMLRYDINLMIFCKAFMINRPELSVQIQNFEFKDRVFLSMVDLICLCMFLSVSPQIREANVSIRSGREKCSTILYNFYSQMSQIHLDALTWMHEIVPILFKPNTTDYAQTLHKILLLDSPEQYSKGDQWPPEPERALLLRLVSEVPLHQDSILRIILIGITKENHFSIPDTMEVIEQVVRRAAGLKNVEYPPVEANKLEIIDFLFNMAEYHHPENIVLPSGYEPPKLAIIKLYWKSWNILLMLSAHNPSVFGSFCWEQYPILRNLMEMCITNQFTDIRPHEDELQLATLEKNQIIEFETYLAAATSKIIITEQTSLLLSQLMLMQPMGISRKPPNYFLEQLKVLNSTHKLGHLLCRSRRPDLLLDIIQRQGTSQSMPWLADLVQNSDGAFNHLPVQCLCEFLLSTTNTFCLENSRDSELLNYLQKLLKDEMGDHQTSCEVLEYFLRRLSSISKQSRYLAIKGLRLLLSTFQEIDSELTPEHEKLESDWLLRHLPLIPHFHFIRPMVLIQLRAACQIENCPNLIMMYIQFIAARTLHDNLVDMLDHIMDMSQLIVERSTIFSHIVPTLQEIHEDKIQTLNCLFVMFNNFIMKLREHNTHTFPEYPDLLMVHFSDGTQCPIHLNIIQAFIILLTHSPMITGALPIIDYWFPLNSPPPQAFSVETGELVQIISDWLKLKMIRSPVERLVDAALQDLTPDQIVLFVQNFGTPVTSMSKLLALLDRAVIEQFDTVKTIILHSPYLSQLIEIQQIRGAKNGHIAVQALELHNHLVTDKKKNKITILETFNVDIIVPDKTTKKFISNTNDIEEIVEIVLTTPTLTKSNAIRFRQLAQQLIGCDNRKIEGITPIQIQDIVSTIVLNYLYRIAKSVHASFFFQNIQQNSSTCSLFRSLLTWIPEKPHQLQNSDKLKKYNYFIEVINECIKYLNPTTHIVLLQILLNKRNTYLKINKNENVQMKKKDFIEIFRTAKNSEVEKKGKIVLNELQKNSNSSQLVEALAAVLKQSETNINDQYFDSAISLHSDKKGLLVDWLAKVDSEGNSNPKIQMDLLFSSSLRKFRFYMLSLLSHQASWSTIQSTINKLLESYNNQFDSTSVLDFITAFVGNPKLWQGRDKATPKHEQIEYVLAMLNKKQIQTLVDYILNESNLKKTEILSTRIDFLMKCINPEEHDLKNLICYVTDHNSNEQIKEKFLQYLYLHIPPIKFLSIDLNNICKGNLTELTGCTADKIIQYIITTISSLSTQRDYQLMAQDTEFLIRKIAASHPSLFLRQLPVLSGLLHGRAHMDFYILRSGYHISFFNQVLGILELLQPQVFEDSYKNGLHSALGCYFDLLNNHDTFKELYSIMYRLMDFLWVYYIANPTAALNLIEPHIELIQILAMNHKHVISLHHLVQGVSFLKHRNIENNKIKDTEIKEEEDSDSKPTTSISVDTDNRGSSASAINLMVPYTKSFPNLPHWKNLMQAFYKKTKTDDILQILQDIENISAKRPGLLEELFEKILGLVFSTNSYIRNIAHILLARHLKYNPGNTFTNSAALNSYIQCLSNEDIGITQSALDTLTEVVICLQEHASEILLTVFKLGISSKINVSIQLKKCIAALKTQHC